MNVESVAAVCAGVSVALPLLARALPKGKREWREVLTRTGVKLVPAEELTALGAKLVRAGLSITPAEFVGARALLCLGFVFSVLPLCFLFGVDFFWVVFFLPLLWFAPVLWLNSRVARRKALIRRQLPDFSVFLATALTAGADLPTALREAGTHVGGPIGEEVERVLLEFGLGRNLVSALEDMADRCDMDELRLLLWSAGRAYAYGTSVAEEVRAQADRQRSMRRFEVMEAAGKLAIYLIFPILFFMLLPLMVVVMYPAAVALYQAFVGR
ncbi:Type II secretion system F domain protein [Ammonifex degensii KC4]|uniref:Type II secretion system F domain protein n=1 Tax=Ammonifex degensii (strain DSM 10501 / KC4) TaxID=429009 RepID=C9RCD5_AMMDK|nr:type II secretion system F family protein [Ammonifex degensii]ACX51912.1 Type II secretion system F domain protein [Ammonifex degensii KC4]